jgi:beta-lactamase regulating signal transducer with metallopeptidase domain
MHLLNQSALLKMLGWALFDSLWQMSLMWLLYLAITSAIKKISAEAKHGIALLLLGTGSFWCLVTLTTNYFNHDFSEQTIITANTFSGGSMSIFSFSKQAISALVPYCSVAYLTVLFFFLIRYFNYYVQSQNLKQAGLHRPPADLRIFIGSVTARIGIHKTVRLWLSSAIQSPMTIGFLKPVILIPLATINHLSPQQMEAVVLHELAHIKRNDYLLNLMVAFAEIIFFFNPFSLMLIHAIKKERENSCDDLVMQFRYDPCSYALALLSLEKARHSHKLALAAVGKSNKMLLLRVMRITGQKIRVHNNSPKFLLILLIAATAAFTTLTQPEGAFHKIKSPDKVAKLQKAHAVELLGVSFINPKSAANKSNVGISCKVKMQRIAKTLNANRPSADNGLELVCNYDQEGAVDDDQGVSNAVVLEPGEYSLAPSGPAVPPANFSLQNYPYVPDASFLYKEIEDTAVPKSELAPLEGEKRAKLALGQNLESINKIDWRKIEKQINVSRKDLDVEKLQDEIRKSLRDLDWDKLNKDVTEATDETDERRLRQDLKVQLQALQEIRHKDLQKTNELEQQIIRQQLRLQQATIKKQQDLIKQVEEVRKKIKIVYI